MGSTDLRGVGSGAWVGCCAGLLGAAEMLAENARTINPVSGAIVLCAWSAAAALAGAACGWLAARAFPGLRLPAGDAAAFFSGFAVGHLFAPPLIGPGTGLLLLGARPLRRSLLPRHGRLDPALPLALAALVGAFVLEAPRALPPATPAGRPLPGGAPLPGSIPVTISVHGAGAFPGIPAVHVRLRELDAEEIGARAALWSGRAPARTRAGQGVPRRLPGGGLSRFPARPAVPALTTLFPEARVSDPAFRDPDALSDIVAAAGIPVLRGPPAPGDPPLFLRILDGKEPPTAEVAARLREGAAWIDVTLSSGPGEIALAGEGIAMARSELPATLMDVAPTALHLLGLAVPRDSDGRVLVELLDRDGPGSRRPRYRNPRAGG